MGTTSHPTLSTVQTEEMTPERADKKMSVLRPGLGLVFKPKIELLEPDVFQIIGDKQDPKIFPWGFWGGLIFSIIGFLWLGYYGAFGFWSVSETMIGVGAVVIGILFFKYGVTSKFHPLEVAKIDGLRGIVSLPGNGDFPMATVEEVVFGMTKYPEAGVKVHVFTLLIRVDDDLIPVVEASPDKGGLFEVAKVISRMSGARLTQVGDGVQ